MSSHLASPLRRRGLIAELRARRACGVCATSAIAVAALVVALAKPTGATLVLLVCAVVAQLVACSQVEERFELASDSNGEVINHHSWSRTTTVRLYGGQVETGDPEVAAGGVVVVDREGGAEIVVPAWRLAKDDVLSQRIAELRAA